MYYQVLTDNFENYSRGRMSVSGREIKGKETGTLPQSGYALEG